MRHSIRGALRGASSGSLLSAAPGTLPALETAVCMVRRPRTMRPAQDGMPKVKVQSRLGAHGLNGRLCRPQAVMAPGLDCAMVVSHHL